MSVLIIDDVSSGPLTQEQQQALARWFEGSPDKRVKVWQGPYHEQPLLPGYIRGLEEQAKFSPNQ